MSINVDVGTPPDGFEGWTSVVVRFHGFANLPTTRDESNYITSPEFSCFDHQWVLDLYPGGHTMSPEGQVGIIIRNRSNRSIKIEYGYGVMDANCREVVHYKLQTFEFGAPGSGHSGRCTTNFAPRSIVMNALVNGSLIIEFRMKPTSTDKSIPQFIPTNPINKNVLKLFMNEESADVVFEVGGEQATNTTTRKKSKTITNFHAHRIILQNCAPTLYEMCRVSGEGGITISITDVSPGIFKHMIYYTYGGKISDKDLKQNAKDIINACDKYGVVHLKLEAEACYVKSTTFSMDNMMDNLLYADSKNLALLKEAVMDFIVKNKHGIMGKVSFDNFPGHLVTDLLTAVSRGHPNEADGNSKNYNKIRVGTLRKMLDEKGLDVDGSRESMIALLKEHSA